MNKSEKEKLKKILLDIPAYILQQSNDFISNDNKELQKIMEELNPAIEKSISILETGKPSILRMKFVFDDEKLKINGITENECLNIIREFFSKHNITEIEKGVFDSPDLNNVKPFLNMGMNLPYTNWFMKVIKEWYFYVENDIEDCIKAYYDVSKRNS